MLLTCVHTFTVVCFLPFTVFGGMYSYIYSVVLAMDCVATCQTFMKSSRQVHEKSSPNYSQKVAQL